MRDDDVVDFMNPNANKGGDRGKYWDKKGGDQGKLKDKFSGKDRMSDTLGSPLNQDLGKSYF